MIGKIELFNKFDIVETHIKDLRGWKFIEFTRGTEGRFIRIYKWYIKYR
jgi:hypothetical protein